ncbi:MAG: response regulator [Lachnospiraceae bacterium]|nr:response regulator [Lachnospiraceae bacterium]
MKRRILIADTNEINREVLSELFEEEYEIIEKESGADALSVIRTDYKDMAAVLLDAELPELDGYEVLENIKKQEWGYRVPVIIISGDASLKAEKRAYSLGAAYFSKKPFDTGLMKTRIDEIAELYEARAAVREEESGNPDAGKKDMPGKENLELANHVFDAMIEFAGRLVESRDPENQYHIYRMKGLTRIMAKKLRELYPEYGLSENDVEMIVTASAVHDIGKVSIPDSIILKPGNLSDEEYEYMKSHTLRGEEIFNDIRFDWDPEYAKITKQVIRSHHEKWDGGGYPDGLKGEEIPVAAQIISLADTYDALVNDRIYRKAFDKETAYNMIISGDTGVFPPKMIECFKACRTDMEKWENQATKERKMENDTVKDA